MIQNAFLVPQDDSNLLELAVLDRKQNLNHFTLQELDEILAKMNLSPNAQQNIKKILHYLNTIPNHQDAQNQLQELTTQLNNIIGYFENDTNFNNNKMRNNELNLVVNYLYYNIPQLLTPKLKLELFDTMKFQDAMFPFLLFRSIIGIADNRTESESLIQLKEFRKLLLYIEPLQSEESKQAYFSISYSDISSYTNQLIENTNRLKENDSLTLYLKDTSNSATANHLNIRKFIDGFESKQYFNFQEFYQELALVDKSDLDANTIAELYEIYTILTETSWESIERAFCIIYGKEPNDIYQPINQEEFANALHGINQDLQAQLNTILTAKTIVTISWQDVFKIFAKSDINLFFDLLKNIGIDTTKNVVSTLKNTQCYYNRNQNCLVTDIPKKEH